MPPANVDARRLVFDHQVAAIMAFVVASRTLHHRTAAAGYRHIGVRGREDLAGLGLLRLQVVWEAFLEDVFVRYMCGATTVSGYAPGLLAPRAGRIDVALQGLIAAENVRYLSWRAGDAIRRARQNFAVGEPFNTAIGAARLQLDEMATIRNRIAHSSGFAAAAFANLVRTHLGYNPRGMTPGRLLLTAYPSGGGLDFISYYGAALGAAAGALVP